MTIVTYEPRDPKYVERITSSFGRQSLMSTLGASLHTVDPGHVVIRLPYDESICQQHGFLHAGAIAAIVDSACGYAALSLAAPGAGVLAVEFKINLMKPAVGDEFFARGRVVRSGRTLTVCSGECVAGEDDSPIAMMQSTIMTVTNRPGLTD